MRPLDFCEVGTVRSVLGKAVLGQRDFWRVGFGADGRREFVPDRQPLADAAFAAALQMYEDAGAAMGSDLRTAAK